MGVNRYLLGFFNRFMVLCHQKPWGSWGMYVDTCMSCINDSINVLSSIKFEPIVLFLHKVTQLRGTVLDNQTLDSPLVSIPIFHATVPTGWCCFFCGVFSLFGIFQMWTFCAFLSNYPLWTMCEWPDLMEPMNNNLGAPTKCDRPYRWFQSFFCFFTPAWGHDPIWLIFFSDRLKSPSK